MRHAHLLLHPSAANCPTGVIAAQGHTPAVPNADWKGDDLGQQEDMKQRKEVFFVLTAKWWDSVEGDHNAKGKVHPSPVTSLHTPTPSLTTFSFLTLKRRKEEDSSLALLMKQNSPSSSCPALWKKREDEPTASPPLGLLDSVRRHCWHGFRCLTLGVHFCPSLLACFFLREHTG